MDAERVRRSAGGDRATAYGSWGLLGAALFLCAFIGAPAMAQQSEDGAGATEAEAPQPGSESPTPRAPVRPPPSADAVEAGEGAALPPREGRTEGRRQRIPVGRTPATPGSQEIQVSAAVRKAVLRNELHRRLSAVSRSQRFSGSAPGGGRWQREALGMGQAVPVQNSFSREVLRTMALRDGSSVWLASGFVSEPSAILRLGDLLPLLSVIGINDREASLSVTEISFGGGSQPPAYTVTFGTGVLWSHRNALAAAEESGRITYSLATGRVTVLGALVLADRDGDLSVRLVSPEGDDLGRYRDLVMAVECRPLEASLRGPAPASAARQAMTLLEQPSVVQACAARYLALSAPEGAVTRIRRLMSTGQVGQPKDVLAALVHLEPTLTEANLQAVVRMVERAGASGAEGVCTHAPLLWSDVLLASAEVSEPNKRVIRRCLRR